MATTSRKVTLYSLLAMIALSVFYLDRRIQESEIQWLDLGGAVYKRFRPTECAGYEFVLPAPSNSPPIIMRDAPELLAEQFAIKSFALSVADANGDGEDDILIGAHENNPLLLINTGDRFENESKVLFAQTQELDRHGYTFADLDNDGDLDLAVAGGGDDGVGTGMPNIFLRNETEDGNLKFVEVSVSPEMAEPSLRARSLMPISSADGRAIDLYFTALKRQGFPNQLFRNTGRGGDFQFEPENSFLTLSINDHGRGVLADFDGDGSSDYLVIEDWRLVLYWHPDSNRRRSILSYQAFSTTVADFNNDGQLDIFLGTFTVPSRSDNLAHSSEELIYVIRKNAMDDSNSIAFESDSPLLEFNLNQHIQATMVRPFVGEEDIHLGRQKAKPGSRVFAIQKQQALGSPATFDEPGTYIWYSTATQQWNMKWVFFDELAEFKGAVKGSGIANVTRTNFTDNYSKPVLDTLLINRGDGRFSELCTGLSAHRETTSDSTVADFNNDGWLDVIGLRQGEHGLPSGDIFVLANDSGKSFTETRISLRERDKLKSADLIAHGFFDADDKPDIFLTNGYGQIPGNDGVPRLLLNAAATESQALLIRLEGANSNRFGVGARLTLTDSSGNIMGFRIQGLNSNISQDTHWVHFGLGAYAAPYTLHVAWPDGTSSEHVFSQPGRYHAKQ